MSSRALSLVFLSLFLACDTRPLGTEQDAVAAGAVLGHLKGRERTLTFYATGSGPRFSVLSRDGKVLAAGLTTDELAARHPELFRLYETSFARGRVLDASVSLPDRAAQLR